MIDTFAVVDATQGALAEALEQERFARHLRETVCAGADLRELIHRRRPASSSYELSALDPIPTAIRFDNQAADSRTVLEIETEDRVGLLYTIAEVLSALALDISAARILTERGAASDCFYLCEADGSKIEAPARQKKIADRLRAALAALGPRRGAE